MLIYSGSWEEYLDHLQAILQILRELQLYVKQSKCTFSDTSVSCFGNIIFANSVFIISGKDQGDSGVAYPRIGASSSLIIRSHHILLSICRN